jgi:hypothetical protein
MSNQHPSEIRSLPDCILGKVKRESQKMISSGLREIVLVRSVDGAMEHAR